MAAYREYPGVMRMSASCGDGASTRATIPVGAMVEAYLDLIRGDRLRGRPLANLKEAELVTSLKREEGLSISKRDRIWKPFCDAVDEAEAPGLIDSNLPMGEDLEIMRRDVRESSRGQGRAGSVCPGGEWKMEYGRAAVHAIMQGTLILAKGVQGGGPRGHWLREVGGGPS